MNTIIYRVEDSTKTYVSTKDGKTHNSVNYYIIGFDGTYISLKLDKFNYAMLPHFIVKDTTVILFNAECEKAKAKFMDQMNNAYKQ